MAKRRASLPGLIGKGLVIFEKVGTPFSDFPWHPIPAFGGGQAELFKSGNRQSQIRSRNNPIIWGRTQNVPSWVVVKGSESETKLQIFKFETRPHVNFKEEGLWLSKLQSGFEPF